MILNFPHSPDLGFFDVQKPPWGSQGRRWPRSGVLFGNDVSHHLSVQVTQSAAVAAPSVPSWSSDLPHSSFQGPGSSLAPAQCQPCVEWVYFYSRAVSVDMGKPLCWESAPLGAPTLAVHSLLLFLLFFSLKGVHKLMSEEQV